ncbi:hypothetical protein [Bosea sp. PAMC 26642]|uniref:hypothetical protein n=1 Tax=Bosea sp. (strain PAMC 26642) TaxID=1792307 RepID=UPI00077008BB|nr:hypothetical protein [Bosea sp. PAMC 26642]AMJ62642.1 hypothetical protein AXW83_22180 [Bosea sp. PAMC 26642]
MRHRPASDFIPSFDGPEISFASVVEEIAVAEPAPIELPSFLLKTPREPAPDLDAIFESGRQAGLAEARAQAQQELDHHLEKAAAALAQARQQWAEEVAAPLATQIPEVLHALGESLADRVGKLLQPFLEAELRDAASRALIAQIGPLLAGSDGAAISIRGPVLLLATLRGVFPEGLAVAFVESDDTEVTIVTADTTIETRIAAWVAKLEGKGPDRRRRPASN